jgi:hypothetical protein
VNSGDFRANLESSTITVYQNINLGLGLGKVKYNLFDLEQYFTDRVRMFCDKTWVPIEYTQIRVKFCSNDKFFWKKQS